MGLSEPKSKRPSRPKFCCLLFQKYFPFLPSLRLFHEFISCEVSNQYPLLTALSSSKGYTESSEGVRMVPKIRLGPGMTSLPTSANPFGGSARGGRSYKVSFVDVSEISCWEW